MLGIIHFSSLLNLPKKLIDCLAGADFFQFQYFSAIQEDNLREWHHFTISQLKKGNTDSTSTEYELLIRVDGQIIEQTTSKLSLNKHKVNVYVSNPEEADLATKFGEDTATNTELLNDHHIYGLRLITERKR